MDKEPDHADIMAQAFTEHLRERKEEQRQGEAETGAALSAQAEESDACPDQGKYGGKHADRPGPVAVTSGHFDLQGQGEEGQGASFGEIAAGSVGSEKDLSEAEKSGQERSERGKSIHPGDDSTFTGQAVGKQHTQDNSQGTEEEGNRIDFKLQQLSERGDAVIFKIQFLHEQGIPDAGKNRPEQDGKGKGKQGGFPRALPQGRQPDSLRASQSVERKDQRGACRHDPQPGIHSASPPSQAEAK